MAWTATSPSPADNAQKEESQDTVTTAAQGGQDLVETRRAAGEATTQAGFLVTGTTELANGSDMLNKATTQLSDGAKQAADGSQQLADGMVQLQAATGELGSGATQIADGVQEAVEQIQGIAAMQGQIGAFIDEADKELAKYPGQDAKDMRAKLGELRNQVNSFKFDGETADKLNQLRDGSRQLADQIGKPGGQFHDGVFAATDASKKLASGLKELGDGTSELNNATGELKQGAERVKGMADQNKTKVQAVQQTLPATNVAQTSTTVDQGDGQTQSLSNVALVIGILVMMAASALWLVAKPFSGIWTPILAVASIAIVGITLLFAFGGTGEMAPGQSIVLILTASAGAFLGRAMIALFGLKVGRGILLASMLIQTVVVALLFGSKNLVLSVFPLYYVLRGLVANPGVELIMSCFILAMFSLGGMTAVRWMGRGQEQELEPADEAELDDEPVPVASVAAG